MDTYNNVIRVERNSHSISLLNTSIQYMCIHRTGKQFVNILNYPNICTQVIFTFLNIPPRS